MVELNNFGWNVLTFSFLMTALFSLLGTWGLIRQLRAIRRFESAGSVSVIWMAVFTGAIAANLPYGLEQGSLTMLLHFACRMPFLALVLCPIYKYRGFTRHETVLFIAVGIGLVWMAIIPARASFFAFFSGAGAVGLAAQPWEIWQCKSAGVVAVELLLIGFCSSLFWALYAWAIADQTLLFLSFAYTVVFTVTLSLWAYYRGR